LCEAIVSVDVAITCTLWKIAILLEKGTGYYYKANVWFISDPLLNKSHIMASTMFACIK